jgi:ABC-type Na+ efflux pump permease subunit
VLVAPVSRTDIVTGKLLGAASLATNPLTYGVAALRHVLSPAPVPGEPSLSMCLLVVALFGIVTLCLSIVLVRRDSR